MIIGKKTNEQTEAEWTVLLNFKWKKVLDFNPLRNKNDILSKKIQSIPFKNLLRQNVFDFFLHSF